MTTNHYFIILNGAGLGGLLLKTKLRGVLKSQYFQLLVLFVLGIVNLNNVEEIFPCEIDNKGEKNCNRNIFFFNMLKRVSKDLRY